MKRILFFLLTAFGIVSCNKEFVDLQPQSQLNAGDFFKTADDIEQGVIGCYDALQSYGAYGRNFVYFMEVRSDNATLESISSKGGIYGDFEDFEIQPSNSVLDETWKTCYAAIQRCNIVLNRMKDIPMNADRKNMRGSEVRFIRCLFYYNMIQIWGDVPLVTTETTDPFNSFADTRTDINLIYQFLEQELKDIQVTLPETVPVNEAGRVSSGAAKILLAKVYFLQQKYQEAKTVLMTIVQSEVYHLTADYAQLFNVSNTDQGEMIFQIQFLKGGVGEGSAYVNLFAPLGDQTLTGGKGNTFGENIPSKTLVASFQSNDKRFKAAIDSLSKGRYYNKKFLDVPYQDMDAGSDFIVFRYADVLLMCAEAENELGNMQQALPYINQVRERAGLSAYTAFSDQQQCRIAIEKERRWELCFENHRWFDLKRTNRAIEVMKTGGYAISEYQLLFPIPQSQIDITNGKIKQNHGY